MCDVVQHVVRSIVPSVNDNGFSRDETEEQQPTHADAAQSPDSADKTPAAPRRRRGGRRVVRGAGAAGAAGGFVTVMVPDLLPADDEMRGLYTMECTSLNEVLDKLKTGEL